MVGETAGDHRPGGADQAENLFDSDGPVGLVDRFFRRLYRLSVVPRHTTCRDDRSRGLSSMVADIKSDHERMALLRHDMEGASGLGRTDRDDDGRLRLLEVWPRREQI